MFPYRLLRIFNKIFLMFLENSSFAILIFYTEIMKLYPLCDIIIKDCFFSKHKKAKHKLLEWRYSFNGEKN